MVQGHDVRPYSLGLTFSPHRENIREREYALANLLNLGFSRVCVL